MSNAPAAFTVPVAALLLILAALSLRTARRGWAGTLTRESRWGIHTPAAAGSDDAFALANKVAAPVVGGAAAIAAVMAVLVLVLPIPSVVTIVAGVLTIAGVLGMIVAGGVIGERAARALPVPARRPAPSAACDGCACGSGGCAGLTRKAVPVDNATG